MARLTIATVAVGMPMGQQVYEREVSARAQDALGPDVEVARSVTRSLRSPLPGTARLPHRLLRDAPTGLRLAVGAAMYRGADVVHRMGMSLPPARVPEIVTVHDTVAWRFPDESSPETFAATELRRARAVVSVSRFAADDVAEHLGLDRVHVIHNGVDERFFDARPVSAESLRGLGVTGPYVLHAGGSSTRKNLEGLADAWPKVRARFPGVSLVLSGPPSERRDRLFGPLDGAVRVGRVPDDVVPGLLAGAEALVVPSLYEGFGLPALEGMAVGTPVVAADRSSLPEVCGDAAVLVEPDGPALAAGLEHVLSGGGEVDRMVARGRERASRFTWDASAAAHARLWHDVLDGRL